MSMLSEQIKELRNYERIFKGDRLDGNLSIIFKEAADTIEYLSAKLQAVNMAHQKGNYSLGDLSELIDKFDNEKIKGITDFEQVQIFNALKYLDMYQKVGTIEKFMELKQNMERSSDDCGMWIPCKERLPEEDNEILITVRVNDVPWIRVGMFHRDTWEILDGMWSFRQLTSMTAWNVTHWMPFPGPYHEP